MSTVILQVLERDLPKLPRRVAGIMEELEDPTQIDRAPQSKRSNCAVT